MPLKGPSPEKDYFISEVTIAKAENISDTIPERMTNVVDCGVKLTLDIGKSFMPILTIFGNFKKDEAGEVSDWGSAYRIRDLLVACGHSGDLPNNKLTEEDLNIMVGKRILKLAFRTGQRDDGKSRYSDWGEIGSVAKGEAAFAKSFLRSVEKGYPKSFQPFGAPTAVAKTDANPGSW